MPRTWKKSRPAFRIGWFSTIDAGLFVKSYLEAIRKQSQRGPAHASEAHASAAEEPEPAPEPAAEEQDSRPGEGRFRGLGVSGLGFRV